MKTLEEIKGGCHIDEDTKCWIWKGSVSNGKWPRIHAPNHSREGSPMMTQTGRRAVWNIKTGEAIPDGWRVYGTCTEDRCINPAHMACGPTAEWGQHMATNQHFKNNVVRIAANRASGRKRLSITPEMNQEILNSPETGVALAQKFGVSRQTISKARRGNMPSLQPVGGTFSGLLAVNFGKRRA